MIPILYEATETSFDTYGIGALFDAVSCKVIQEINGEYELEMEYPLEGIFFAEISLERVIKASPDSISNPQPFRIYRITKPLNGIVTIYARHLAYDLSGIAVTPFTANGLADALAALKNNSVTGCPFTFESDINSATTFTVAVPSNIWGILGSENNGLLSTYGGEYEFNGYTINLWNERGTDRGVSVKYGKNLTSLEQDANCANCYTEVFPYWTNGDNSVVITLPEKIIKLDGAFNHAKTLVLDVSGELEEEPTIEELRAKANQYISENKIGVPVVSWKIEFVQFENSEEYVGQSLFEKIFLGDAVEVEFKDLDIYAKAKAVATEYDVLAEKYNSITLGSVKNNIADTIAEQSKELEKKPSKTLMQNIISSLTAAMLGANGGSVRVLDTNGDNEPDTLYIADDPDPIKAVKVWRFNYEGWGASSSGYNGPFIMGATLEDGILANAITAANIIAGTIRSADGETFFLDLDNGILEINAVKKLATDMTKQYETIMAESRDALDAALKDYVENEDYEAYQAIISAQLEFLANQVTIEFQKTLQEVQGINEELQTKYNSITQYFRFELDGFSIGESDSPFKVVIDEKKLTMYMGDTVIIDLNPAGTSHIPDVEINERLNLFGYAITQDHAGNVNCSYVGG